MFDWNITTDYLEKDDELKRPPLFSFSTRLLNLLDNAELAKLFWFLPIKCSHDRDFFPAKFPNTSKVFLLWLRNEDPESDHSLMFGPWLSAARAPVRARRRHAGVRSSPDTGRQILHLISQNVTQKLSEIVRFQWEIEIDIFSPNHRPEMFI